MKRFIFLFAMFLFVAVSACAGDDNITYTSYGKGVELITKETSSFWRGDQTLYGLRKGGVVLEEPRTPNIQLQEELNIIAFEYRNGVRVYNLNNGAEVGAFFVDYALGNALHTPKVTIKPIMKNGKKCYTIHYSNYSDQSGRIEQDVVTLYQENGKLYKFEKKEVQASVEI